MATETTFTLNFKTIAELTGLDRLVNGVQTGARTIQSINTQFATLLASAGTFLTASKLNEYANMASKAREAQAAFEFTVLRSKDGTRAFLNDLNAFNRELEKTTDTSYLTSQAIEQQFLIFQTGGKYIKDLTRLTIDFAKARGMDPGEAGKMLSRAISGEDLVLTRFGIHLDKTKPKLEQMRDLLRQLEAMVGGTAKVMADADGGITQAEFAWRDLKTAIGNVVNLVKIPFLLQLSAGLQDSRGKTDALTGAQSSLGRSIYVTAGLIGHWIAEHIRLVQVTVAAGGAILAYRGAVALFGATLGRAFLPIGLIIAALTALDKAQRALTESTGGFSVSLAESYKFIGRALLVVVETNKAAIPAMVAFVGTKVREVIHDTITELYVLAQKTSDILSRLSGGTISLGDFGEEIVSHATEAEKAKRAAEKTYKDIVQIGWKAGQQFGEEYWKAVQASAEGDDAKAALEKQFKDYADFAAKMESEVKKGPSFNGPGDTSGAKAAATDALAAAKFRLASAEEAYRGALEQTKLLEEGGLITREQATARNLQATRDYIAELQRLRSVLPALIAQLEAVGNTKGASEARLEFQQLTNKIIEAQITLSNSSFFGQMRAQLSQLANEWGNLGKQMGDFMTAQFQNLAQVGGQVISDLIFRTGNWKQAIMQLGPAFVSQLAQMLIQWVLSRTVMSTLSHLFGAKDQAATSAMAAGAAAAWAPAATSAAIATSGVAAGSGLTALLAAMAVGVAAIIGMVGFQRGGFTGDGPSDEIAGVVHRGEVVFPAGRVRELGRDFLVEQATGAITRPGAFRGGGASSVAAEHASGARERERKQSFHLYLDQQQLLRALRKDPATEKFVIDLFNGKRHRFRG